MSWASDITFSDPERYTTIDAPMGSGIDVELEVKRSRFLTRLRRVATEEEARTVIEGRRKKYFDARHHCSAFVLGAGRHTARSSDDGEPPGTAGVPMLSVLQHHELSDVVAVVTRYFGGVKLGAGGLVRAYSEAVAHAVTALGTRDVLLTRMLRIDVPISEAGSVEAQLRSLILPGSGSIAVNSIDWADTAVISIAVRSGSETDFHDALASMSGGLLIAHPAGTRWSDT